MMTDTFLRKTVLATALLFAACGTAGPRSETVAARRVPDAAPGLDLEAEDQRWGFEAARERRRDRPKKAGPPPAAATATGSIDVKAP